MKVAAILQARMGSSRLPGKVMLDVAGKPLLEHVLERAKLIPDVDSVVLATTNSADNQPLLKLAKKVGVTAFAGSEDDVLDRYYQAARSVNADAIVRLTGDCPLLDPTVCYDVLDVLFQGRSDYVSNVRPPMYPDGLDTEVFTMDALATAWRDAELASDREHVTQFMWRQPEKFRITNIVGDFDLSHMRWTVDEADDLEFVRQVFDGLRRRGWNGHDFREVVKVIEEDGLRDASGAFARNEGQIDAMRGDQLEYSTEMEQFSV